MGGKFANYDNREVPDTLEVLWHYPGDTLVTFSQFNATAAPAGASGACEIEFRGTKGTLYLAGNGYEIVPDDDHAQRVPGAHAARPHSRARLADGREAADRADEARPAATPTRAPRPQLPRLRQEPRSMPLRHRDRPPQHHGDADRQHRPPDAGATWNGTRRPSASPTTTGGEQAAELRVPRAVQGALDVERPKGPGLRPGAASGERALEKREIARCRGERVLRAFWQLVFEVQ